MFERLDIAISDKLIQRNVIAEGGEPELGDTGGCGGDAFGEVNVFVILFGVDLLASLYLFGGGGSLAIDDVVAALVEGFLQLEVLKTKDISSRLIGRQSMRSGNNEPVTKGRGLERETWL